MIKQTHKNFADERNKFNENEKLAVSNYISDSSKTLKSRKKSNLKTDDIIGLLSDAYENQRARQVFEWENIRRKSFQKAA